MWSLWSSMMCVIYCDQVWYMWSFMIIDQVWCLWSIVIKPDWIHCCYDWLWWPVIWSILLKLSRKFKVKGNPNYVILGRPSWKSNQPILWAVFSSWDASLLPWVVTTQFLFHFLFLWFHFFVRRQKDYLWILAKVQREKEKSFLPSF